MVIHFFLKEGWLILNKFFAFLSRFLFSFIYLYSFCLSTILSWLNYVIALKLFVCKAFFLLQYIFTPFLCPLSHLQIVRQFLIFISFTSLHLTPLYNCAFFDISPFLLISFLFNSQYFVTISFLFDQHSHHFLIFLFLFSLFDHSFRTTIT